MFKNVSELLKYTDATDIKMFENESELSEPSPSFCMDKGSGCVLDNLHNLNSTLESKNAGGPYIFDEIMSLFNLKSLIFAAVLYYIYVWCSPIGRHLYKFKGLPVFPFIGTAYACVSMSKVEAVIDFVFRYYGDNVGRFWLVYKPYIVTINVKIIEKVLSDPIHAEKGEAYENAHFFMSPKGIVVVNLDSWKQDRKMLLPAVKTSMFDLFLESFNRHTTTLIDVLHQRFPTGTEKLDVMDNLGRCTLDIVFDTIVDMPLNLQKNPKLGILEAYKNCTALVAVKTFQPWVKIPFLWKLLGYDKILQDSLTVLKTGISMQKVQERLLEWKRLKAEQDPYELDKMTKKYADLLYINKDSPEEIFYQFLTILAAGFETSMTSLNHTLFQLALNPEAQKKIQEEVDSVFQGDFDRDVTQEDLSNLKYTELVLKEGMRIMAPTPLLGRKIGRDVPLDDGTIIPKGCNFMVPTWHVMRSEALYPEPLKFMPERFLPENSHGRSPYAFLPFSYGPRSCFGQRYAYAEMKIILAKIMGNFSLTTERRMEDLKVEYGIVTHVIGGLPVTLHRRTPA